jgi:hypothetical protein
MTKKEVETTIKNTMYEYNDILSHLDSFDIQTKADLISYINQFCDDLINKMNNYE